MDMEDLHKLMAQMIFSQNELLAAHRETEHHAVQRMQRQSDIEAVMQSLQTTADELKTRNGTIEKLTKEVAENSNRLSTIVLAHDDNIEERDARLKRLEQRLRGEQQ